MKNHLLDVGGLTIGHAGCDTLVSGVTAVMFDAPAVASAAVVGGAPAGRDLECLMPDRLVSHIDAIVLSGGSGFGLDAAGGVQAWLREHGRGLPVGGARVPIVPQAICFDLSNGGDKHWGRFSPYRDLGFAAADAATSDDLRLGSIGGGLGATTVNFKGGIGAASATTSGGATIAALMLVNALGSATVGDGPHFWAGAFEEHSEFGGYGAAGQITSTDRALRWKGQASRAQNVAPPHATTIGLIATDAKLSKSEAHRLAIAGHDGFARGLRLTHALFDGDILFAASVGQKDIGSDPSAAIELGCLGGDCVARAIARAVFEADRPGPRYAGPPPYRELHPARRQRD